MEKAVRPFSPYPRLFILSAVSMALSSDHVTMMEKTFMAFFVRRRRLPFSVSRPMYFWACATVCSWVRNRGTKRMVIDSTSDRAGITLPKR